MRFTVNNGVEFNSVEFYKDKKARGLLLKVKIHLDDVSCVVYEGDKLRCTKFYVIEDA